MEPAMPEFRNDVTGTENAIVGGAENGVGVFGKSGNGHGVEGYSQNNIAVFGYTPNGSGVSGRSDQSFGVEGISKDSIGVFGGADGETGIGVYGKGRSIGVYGSGEVAGKFDGKVLVSKGMVIESGSLVVGMTDIMMSLQALTVTLNNVVSTLDSLKRFAQVRLMTIICDLIVNDGPGVDQGSFHFGIDDVWVTPNRRLVKQYVGKHGGEIRVEIDIIAWVDATDAIKIEGEARLYEGTSEDTTDLDGKLPILATIPAGSSHTHVATVRNVYESSPDDYGHYSIRFKNNS